MMIAVSDINPAMGWEVLTFVYLRLASLVDASANVCVLYMALATGRALSDRFADTRALEREHEQTLNRLATTIQERNSLERECEWLRNLFGSAIRGLRDSESAPYRGKGAAGVAQMLETALRNHDTPEN